MSIKTDSEIRSEVGSQVLASSTRYNKSILTFMARIEKRTQELRSYCSGLKNEADFFEKLFIDIRNSAQECTICNFKQGMLFKEIIPGFTQKPSKIFRNVFIGTGATIACLVSMWIGAWGVSSQEGWIYQVVRYIHAADEPKPTKYNVENTDTTRRME